MDANAKHDKPRPQNAGTEISMPGIGKLLQDI
jgi:hypothetical protein